MLQCVIHVLVTSLRGTRAAYGLLGHMVHEVMVDVDGIQRARA